MPLEPLIIHPGQAVPLDSIPEGDIEAFHVSVVSAVRAGGRLSAFFGSPREDGRIRLVAVIAQDEQGRLSVASTTVTDRFRSLTPDCPQAHWFEREIAEQWGVRPEGHPWLKPIRFHHAYRSGRDVWGRAADATILPCVTDFFRVEGEEVHEVAVGPVHAGIIEPGHFRFQCHGERVFHLEISLGYQHRGIEPALAGGPDARTVHYMETLAGDTTIGHATAYAQIVEGLSGIAPPPRAEALRAVALELERLANHTGDMGALANDVGFLPTANYCGRIRGDFLNLTAMLCGNRFGRNLVRPGGVAYDLEAASATQLCQRIEAVARDAENAIELLWDKPSVLARFEDTGRIAAATAKEIGLVGVAARASGLLRDVRFDFPAGHYRFAQIPVSTWDTGDVFARAYVRWLEIQRSVDFVRQQLGELPPGAVRQDVGRMGARQFVVALVEGWRGEICHVALTDAEGRFSRYKVVDPSFHNWMGLALALREQQISDFPLCNKSFNLSYCGHDL